MSEKTCINCGQFARSKGSPLCGECLLFPLDHSELILGKLKHALDIRHPESDGFGDLLDAYIDLRIRRALRDRRVIGLPNVVELDELN